MRRAADVFLARAAEDLLAVSAAAGQVAQACVTRWSAPSRAELEALSGGDLIVLIDHLNLSRLLETYPVEACALKREINAVLVFLTGVFAVISDEIERRAPGAPVRITTAEESNA